ncbi:RNase H domain-containing protein [Trichonephila clavipes]|nr:RNase H domain-containing protein [Trichonephila clavipes]
MSYASRAWGNYLSKKINSRLIRRTQRRFLLRVIKGYKTISYEAVFAISGIPPIDLVILNNLDVRENYLSTSLGTLDGTIPLSLLSHPSCRKPITLVTYTNEVFQEYKTVCFTDGSKLNGRDSLCQGGTLDFLICTDSLSSLHCLLSVNSTEKLVVEVQSILCYLDCDIHFSYVRGHSGNLGNYRVDQLAKEATCQDMNLLMPVLLSHWKHVAWERTVSSWNTKFLASPKALRTKSCGLLEKKFQMAFLEKAEKQNLVLLAEELGQKVSDKMTIIDLKNIIIGSKDYEEEFVRAQLSVISEER